MELAKHLYNMARYPASNDDGGKRTIDGIARALTAYGDQRAREARQQILVDSTPLREAVAREARAAAIKEAMQDVRDFFDSPDNRGVLDDLPLIEQLEQRRALAAAPPQSEGGEG
jgi:hypothetical protein